MFSDKQRQWDLPVKAFDLACMIATYVEIF